MPNSKSSDNENDSVKVKVIPTPGQWYGMTFQEDVPVVQGALKSMTDVGLYPSPLCSH